MNPEPIRFTNQQIQLAGTLYKPDGPPPYPCLIVLHTATGGLRTYPFYQHLTTRLPEADIALFLFDRRGAGESAGNFETADFNDLASDAVAAIEHLSARADIDPSHFFLYGISQGGWIAPVAAARRPDVAGVVIVSGSGVSPARQMDYSAVTNLQAKGFSESTITTALALRAHVNNYFRGNLTYETLKSEIAAVENEPWFDSAFIDHSENIPQDVTQDKWYYEMDFDPLAIWQRVNHPTLFLFPDHDQWVPIAESMSAYRSETTHLADVSFQQIPRADHLMTETLSNGTERISETYIAALLAWLTKHT